MAPIISNQTTEAILSAILILVGLRCFEYIVYTIIMLGSRDEMSTRRYAYKKAVEKAWNPLTLCKWLFNINKLDTRGGTVSEAHVNMSTQRKIGCFFVVLVLISGEAALFYGTQSTTQAVTIRDLDIAFLQSNQINTAIKADASCDPTEVPNLNRLSLNAIAALCYQTIPQSIFTEETIEATIERNDFSLTVQLNASGTIDRATAITSLLLPGGGDIVVQLLDNIQTNAVQALRDYYTINGCDISGDSADRLSLDGCESQLSARVALFEISQYIQVERRKSLIGSTSEATITPDRMETEIGQFDIQNFTTVGIIVIASLLVVIAMLLNLFANDSSEEIISDLIKEAAHISCTINSEAFPDRTICRHASVNETGTVGYVGVKVPPGFNKTDSLAGCEVGSVPS